MTDQLRVRIPRVNLFAVVVAAICTLPLAFASPWLAIVWLLPLSGLLHVLRTGVDADTDGVTARTMLRSRRLSWDDIAGLRIRGARIAAVLRDGSAVRLPVLRPRHLSLLSTASGGRLPDPTASAPAQ
jgi:Bacterial PH domain